MARTYDALDDTLIDWMGRQHVFFVATAPSGPDGHVNVSPKGYDTFRVLGPTTVAYLDLTGSGVETIAHLRDNGRITIMFCAFEGPPRILRLWGRGEAVPAAEGADGEADGRRAGFPDVPGARAVVRVELDRIATSCGFGVPFLEYREERSTLRRNLGRRGPEDLAAYRRDHNATSIDGLPGLPATSATSPP
jgi:hypothetical protein